MWKIGISIYMYVSLSSEYQLFWYAFFMGGRLNGTLVVAEVIKNVLNNINNDHYCMTIEGKGYNFIPKS